MGEMTALTRSIMPCVNLSYAGQVGLSGHPGEAAADKYVDFGREMMTIRNKKAALFTWTSAESACCGGPTPVAGRNSKRLAWTVRLAVVALVILTGIWFVTGMPGSTWTGPLPPLTGK